MTMRIVVTGADGFIGKNLRVRLAELGHSDLAAITRDSAADDQLYRLTARADTGTERV